MGCPKSSIKNRVVKIEKHAKTSSYRWHWGRRKESFALSKHSQPHLPFLSQAQPHLAIHKHQESSIGANEDTNLAGGSSPMSHEKFGHFKKGNVADP